MAIDLSSLEKQIGYRLRRAQLAVFGDFIRSFAEHDIKPGQYSVLAVIAGNPGSRPSSIAEALGIKRPNFVALIDGLERRGLVARSAAAGDRRSHVLSLTPSGRRLLGRLDRLATAHERRIAVAIGSKAERAALLAVLGRLAAPAGA